MVPGDLSLSQHLIHRIVFTGGPCGGKTTAISTSSETLKELGNGVICVPEAASLIFSQGGVLDMTTYTPYQGIEFQMALMKLQMCLEDIFTKIVCINLKSKHVYILCDRGLMDGSAYLSREQWEVLLNEMGIYEQDIREERYDQVIHMITAADGADQYYNLKGNAARSEAVADAIDLDKKLRNSWMAHPNYFLISNDCKDFDSKVKIAENCLLQMQEAQLTVSSPGNILLAIRMDCSTKSLPSTRSKLSSLQIPILMQNSEPPKLRVLKWSSFTSEKE